MADPAGTGWLYGCPAAALPAEGWQAEACLPWQAANTTCAWGCLARAACPVGAAHRYAADQHRYHHTPSARGSVLDALWR